MMSEPGPSNRAPDQEKVLSKSAKQRLKKKAKIAAVKQAVGADDGNKQGSSQGLGNDGSLDPNPSVGTPPAPVSCAPLKKKRSKNKKTKKKVPSKPDDADQDSLKVPGKDPVPDKPTSHWWQLKNVSPNSEIPYETFEFPEPWTEGPMDEADTFFSKTEKLRIDRKRKRVAKLMKLATNNKDFNKFILRHVWYNPYELSNAVLEVWSRDQMICKLKEALVRSKQKLGKPKNTVFIQHDQDDLISFVEDAIALGKDFPGFYISRRPAFCINFTRSNTSKSKKIAGPDTPRDTIIRDGVTICSATEEEKLIDQPLEPGEFRAIDNRGIEFTYKVDFIGMSHVLFKTKSETDLPYHLHGICDAKGHYNLVYTDSYETRVLRRRVKRFLETHEVSMPSWNSSRTRPVACCAFKFSFKRDHTDKEEPEKKCEIPLVASDDPWPEYTDDEFIETIRNPANSPSRSTRGISEDPEPCISLFNLVESDPDEEEKELIDLEIEALRKMMEAVLIADKFTTLDQKSKQFPKNIGKPMPPSSNGEHKTTTPTASTKQETAQIDQVPQRDIKIAQRRLFHK